MKSACCAAAPHGFACRPWTDGAPTIFGLADLPLINVIELLSGLVLLLIGAELMVRAAVRLAERLHVRPLIIGLTIVALGSSAPQMTVSLQAALTDNPDIAVGSVVGSGIFNILVTLGLSALIIPLRVSRQLVRLDIPLMIGASLLVFILAWNKDLGRFDGVLLLGALALYLGLLFRQSRHSTRPHTERPTETQQSWLISVLMILAGLAMLVFAGRLLLGAAVVVATDLGLSERVIGLTVVAVGTSLPELATSLIAALRGQRDIAVGNVIGANLFNLLGVLGLTALLAPTPLSVSPNALDFDLPVMLGVAALCLPVFYSGYRVTRAEGLLLLGLYLVYGLHVVSFTTGMPLAGKLERLMLFYVLPALLTFLLFTSIRAWRRQHHKRDVP
ncbi:conjugal transfer protein TraR [Pseudomonas moraviensis R28-S]|jgi:cation:H+ antiporter|uniref:Conjugal transfer protein TraR n=2 Tax=Pseudomonas TaxID=286 RepID=V8RA17_9PSED|nr:conjugal transfer protein TraR [Pseudomonas moraviensis R28-S]